MRLISKSEATRIIRSKFGSLCRVEETELSVRALDDEGDLIVEVERAKFGDPYRRLLELASQLQLKPDPATMARQEANQRNVVALAQNLLNRRRRH